MIQQLIFLIVFFAIAFFILAHLAFLLYVILFFMAASSIYRWIKQKKPAPKPEQATGRIIESDEWHQL